MSPFTFLIFFEFSLPLSTSVYFVCTQWYRSVPIPVFTYKSSTQSKLSAAASLWLYELFTLALRSTSQPASSVSFDMLHRAKLISTKFNGNTLSLSLLHHLDIIFFSMLKLQKRGVESGMLQRTNATKNDCYNEEFLAIKSESYNEHRR